MFPSRQMVSETLSPTFLVETTSARLESSVRSFPSILVMMSPGLMPDLSA